MRAYQDAQVDMKRSALKSAQSNLVTCLSETCPRSLHTDCAQWLKEVESRQPTVVLSYLGKDGQPLVAAEVTVDGKPFVDRLDGRSLQIDPGEHTFRFSVPPEAPVEVKIIVREGEKAQRVDATSKLYSPSLAPREAERPPVRQAPLAVTPTARPVPWTVFALTGLGAVAAAGFAGFALSGTSGKADLDVCRPFCDPGEVSSVRTRFVIADVSLIVSVLAFAGAATLYFTRPEVPVPSGAPPRSLRWLGSAVRGEF